MSPATNRLIIIGVEVLALVALRLIYTLNRDKGLPRGSKVSRIKGKPVYRVPFPWKRKPRSKGPNFGGWTPPPRRDRLNDTPDGSPVA